MFVELYYVIKIHHRGMMKNKCRLLGATKSIIFMLHRSLTTAMEANIANRSTGGDSEVKIILPEPF